MRELTKEQIEQVAGAGGSSSSSYGSSWDGHHKKHHVKKHHHDGKNPGYEGASSYGHTSTYNSYAPQPYMPY